MFLLFIHAFSPYFHSTSPELYLHARHKLNFITLPYQDIEQGRSILVQNQFFKSSQ
ncbi:hypothetical protein METHB2_180059 [Candidatus Methylobacter favarea]|uniref:Uncharacterized protein n=1 Tax=Candidatus Methylobacter favarea TaxID=2707345 RepID=A0A8S0Y9G5_9GAMM|nr:hypothetical protein METHB2_180059 [Candidatus Methylobacter favarea]